MTNETTSRPRPPKYVAPDPLFDEKQAVEKYGPVISMGEAVRAAKYVQKLRDAINTPRPFSTPFKKGKPIVIKHRTSGYREGLREAKTEALREYHELFECWERFTDLTPASNILSDLASAVEAGLTW